MCANTNWWIEASLVLYKINGTLIGAGAHKHCEATRYGDGVSYYCFLRSSACAKFGSVNLKAK